MIIKNVVKIELFKIESQNIKSMTKLCHTFHYIKKYFYYNILYLILFQ